MSSAQLDKLRKIKPADIEWRDGLPFSREFNDIYFSQLDGVAETEHVFIRGNHLPDDWLSSNQQYFTIGELGFGSGLNFLVTSEYWRQARANNTSLKTKHLNFISIEKRPFSKQDLHQALACWPQYQSIGEQLLAQYPAPVYGRYRVNFNQDNIHLTLIWMPVEDALTDLLNESTSRQNSLAIDHWFLDGFAPAKNESMWHDKVIHKIAKLSRQGSRLATFSVAAAVKSPLQSAGFHLKKTKGFAHKREMLTASFSGLHKPLSTPTFINLKKDKPWLFHQPPSQKEKIAIIGSGIAGATLANELSNHSVSFDLIDAASSIAEGASKVAAGVFHPQLTGDFNLSSQLHWQAYLTLISGLNSFTKKQQQTFFKCFQLNRHLPKKNLQQLKKLCEEFYLTEWIKPQSDYLKFVHSGAISLKAYCDYLINDALSRSTDNASQLLLEQKVTQFTRSKAAGDPLDDTRLDQTTQFPWELTLENKHQKVTKRRYHQVIFCSGALTKNVISDLANLTHISRGQTCLINNNHLPISMNHALCGESYIAPHDNNRLVAGATFENFVDDNLKQISQNNILDNLETLIARPLIEKNNIPLNGQVGYRLHAEDRMPLVGPLPDFKKLENDFSQIGDRRIRWGDMRAYNYPGVWINSAYGSHGLLLSRLMAQHVTALVLNQVSPVSFELSQRFHPARLIINQLKKNKKSR